MSSGFADARGTLRFLLDGEVVEIESCSPTRTLLQYLREDRSRTGTKEGCAEGDCGACTVVVADEDDHGRLRVRAVNSCIQFLPTLDGKELFTVESLAAKDGALHPVQQALVDEHGSQCGFCTPGFVMSLFALFKNERSPSRIVIDDALAGNLCRCTGYLPIVAAAKKMYSTGSSSSDWLLQPNGADSAASADKLSALRDLDDSRPLLMRSAEGSFIAPRNLEQLADARLEHSDATLLAGGTDVGLWVTKQHRELPDIIYTGRVAELGRVQVDDDEIRLGAAVTITDAAAVLMDEYPELDELFLRYGSPPIRNAATLGGNVANGSPIGDSMPALIALDASLELRRGEKTRRLPLEAFYLNYQETALAAGEFVQDIVIPRRTLDLEFGTYKVSKRFDQDISAVCAAFALRRDSAKIVDARVAFGGMAATPKRAPLCEAALIGSALTDSVVDDAATALTQDFQPISDARASADYRQQVSRNLLRRFYLERVGGEPPGIYRYGRA